VYVALRSNRAVFRFAGVHIDAGFGHAGQVQDTAGGLACPYCNKVARYTLKSGVSLSSGNTPSSMY